MVMESIRLNKDFFLGAYKQKALYSTLLMIMIYRVQLKQGLFGFKPFILDLISKNSGPKEIKLLKRLTLFRLKSSYISMFSAVLNYFEEFPFLFKFILIAESKLRYFTSKRLFFHIRNRALIGDFLNNIYHNELK